MTGFEPGSSGIGSDRSLKVFFCWHCHTTSHSTSHEKGKEVVYCCYVTPISVFLASPFLIWLKVSLQSVCHHFERMSEYGLPEWRHCQQYFCHLLMNNLLPMFNTLNMADGIRTVDLFVISKPWGSKPFDSEFISIKYSLNSALKWNKILCLTFCTRIYKRIPLWNNWNQWAVVCPSWQGGLPRVRPLGCKLLSMSVYMIVHSHVVVVVCTFLEIYKSVHPC